MSRSATNDNSNGIGLFPFLAVLMSTMGALLVVMVILAQRAGERAAFEQMRGADELPIAATGDGAELAAQLAKVRAYRHSAEQLLKEGEARVRDEQARLSHVEEHMRRMEHELAQLSIAAQQLAATEQNQVVDREQAAAELERVKQMIADYQEQSEKLRQEGHGKRSYAVVPFQGRNGTFRKPIYIECTAEGIILQPEGLRLEDTDFLDPTWPGNPLAAALRASREYHNRRAAESGVAEMPDPYPLILVRPDGIMYYALARKAITSWDAAFGYEFVDDDWKIEYPDLPDPQLAREQQHAVMIARERLAYRIQSAPSQFRGLLAGTTGTSGGRGDASGGYGFGGPGGGTAAGGNLAEAYGSGSGEGEHGAGATGGSGADGDDANGDGDGGGGSGDLAAGSEIQYGNTNGAGEPGTGGPAGGPAGGPGGAAGPYPSGPNAGSATGELASASGTTASGPAGNGAAGNSANATGASGVAGGAPSGTAASGQVAGSPGATGGSPGAGAAGGTGQPSPSINLGGAPGDSPQQNASGRRPLQQVSIADSRGSDWALQKTMRTAIPVQRPIQVVVRHNQMSILPSRHATNGVDSQGTVIALDQSLNEISDQFVAALKTRIDEWGLAGNGLYWKPVLELHVGPDAAETAERLNHLLRDSGVEIRLPETAQSQQGGTSYAPR